ncbi:mercury resistance system transport protein MerF [Candidatus Halocynthiibacter alkanivorans]|uniref:mercury resistance system transport protein MerF n=1 Tax=Candidatus Halocynthiibacter alkanivorans TaxID=2267619 RepID=UPI000DF37B14|nr:mercury resistance system transport protein MerF [Candidatus Halocynthiibacter alkanivorans]
MNDKKLLKTGLIGTAVMSVCCFTPLLVVMFGLAGLTAFVGYLDPVLLPALGVFILMTIVALIRRKRRSQT